MGISQKFRWHFWIVAAALLIGLGLTVVSWLGICAAECAVGHKYRLYGFPFEVAGFGFFISMGILHSISWWKPPLSFLVLLLIASAIGAEAMFLLIQKFWIGHWCPICVSIAITLSIAALTLLIHHYRLQKGNSMNTIWKGTTTFSIFVLGFLFAFLGVSQINPLEAQEVALKEQLSFGDRNSPIEVYIFTDWACPACRKLEPMIEKMTPTITKEAKLFFIDYVIHPETLNYSPYNASFMIYNKPKYLSLRHVLTQLSLKTSSPTEDQIEAIAEKMHIKYTPLKYSEIAQVATLFKDLGTKFRIRKTPTMIVFNPETKKGKRLEGSAEITDEKVQAAIQVISNG